MPSQPVPSVTADEVARVVHRDFPADSVAGVFALLEQYGDASSQNEPHRVRLAALKLAAGKIDQLRREIENARCDYRDVLAAAEYPGYFRHVPRSGALASEAEQQIIDADWRQYQDWLKR
jgi:hypothetical protein